MNNTRFLFIFAIICFFVDGTTVYITQKLPIHTLVLFCLYAMVYAHNYALFGMISLLLAMQDIVLYDQWNIHLIVLLPLILINNIAHHFFYPNIIQLFCTGVAYWCICWCMCRYLISFTYQNPAAYRLYTALPFSTILIGISLIYMVIQLSGIQGNRIKTRKKTVSL